MYTLFIDTIKTKQLRIIENQISYRAFQLIACWTVPIRVTDTDPFSPLNSTFTLYLRVRHGENHSRWGYDPPRLRTRSKQIEKREKKNASLTVQKDLFQYKAQTLHHGGVLSKNIVQEHIFKIIDVIMQRPRYPSLSDQLSALRSSRNIMSIQNPTSAVKACLQLTSQTF